MQADVHDMQVLDAFDYPDPQAPPPPPRPITSVDLLAATTEIVGSMLIGEHMAARLTSRSSRAKATADLTDLFLATHAAIQHATTDSQPAASTAAQP